MAELAPESFTEEVSNDASLINERRDRLSTTTELDAASPAEHSSHTDHEKAKLKIPELSLSLTVDADFLKMRESAICSQTDPEVFFPEQGGSTRTAKKICTQVCELQEECLQYALSTKEQYGVWGGHSPSERKKLHKRLHSA